MADKGTRKHPEYEDLVINFSENVFDSENEVGEIYTQNVKSDRNNKQKKAAVHNKKDKKTKKDKSKNQKKKVDSEKTTVNEPLTKKDHVTFFVAVFALILATSFICVKYFL